MKTLRKINEERNKKKKKGLTKNVVSHLLHYCQFK